MEQSGKVIAIADAKTGVSAKTGNPWMTQTFVIQPEGEYAKPNAFEIFGEDRIKANMPQVGDVVTVSFDIESRDFNGQWYTSLRAWKVEKATAAQPAAQPMPFVPQPVQAPQPQPQPVQATLGDNTGLPF